MDREIQEYQSVVAPIDSTAPPAQKKQADKGVEEEITEDQAIQELIDGEYDIKKKLEKLESQITDLQSKFSALHDSVMGFHDVVPKIMKDLSQLSENVKVVHREIKEHEEHSDEEHRRCCDRGKGHCWDDDREKGHRWDDERRHSSDDERRHSSDDDRHSSDDDRRHHYKHRSSRRWAH
jgi:uncharacterized protein YukE